MRRVAIIGCACGIGIAVVCMFVEYVLRARGGTTFGEWYVFMKIQRVVWPAVLMLGMSASPEPFLDMVGGRVIASAANGLLYMGVATGGAIVVRQVWRNWK